MPRIVRTVSSVNTELEEYCDWILSCLTRTNITEQKETEWACSCVSGLCDVERSSFHSRKSCEIRARQMRILRCGGNEKTPSSEHNHSNLKFGSCGNYPATYTQFHGRCWFRSRKCEGKSVVISFLRQISEIKKITTFRKINASEGRVGVSEWAELEGRGA